MHPDHRLSRRAPRPARLHQLALSAALALGGCAQLPDDLAEPPELKPVASYASREALTAPVAAWPQQQWWTTYGDKQLDRLIDEALADAPSLQAAAARLRQAEAGVQVADALSQPQVSASASATQDKLSYNYITPAAATPQGWNDYGRVTLDMRWELDFWGKHRAGLAAATSELEAGRAELAQARLLLASSVAAHYAELNRLHVLRDTAQRALEIRSQTAELFAERQRNGLENRGSVRQADSHRAAAAGALLALDEQIVRQRHQLAALLGAGPDRGLTIAVPTLKLDRAFGLPEQLALDLLGRRPDVVAARLVAEAQARRIDQKKAQFYPNVNLNAMLGLQSLRLDRLGDSGSDIGSIGPAISLPLFTAGRLQGELRGAHARYAEAVAHYNGTVARALQDVADATTSQRALTERLARGEEAAEAAAEAHRVARNRYEGGLASNLEVLAAEGALLDSLNALSNLRSYSLSLDIALQRALGGGYQTAQR